MTLGTRASKRRGKPFREDITILLVMIMMLLVMVTYDVTRDVPEHFVARFPGQGPEPPLDPSEGTVSITEELERRNGYTAEETSTEIGIEVPWDDAVEMSIVLDWTDDHGDNDEFEVGVRYEGDGLDERSSTSGHIEVTISDPLPGNYTIIVTAVDCPGQLGPMPVDRDNGNDWTLEVTADREVET